MLFDSDKTLYCLLFVAVIVLLVGNLTCSNAVSVDDTSFNATGNVISTDNELTNTNDKPIITEKSLNKNIKTENVKQNGQLEEITLSTDDIECNYGEVVNIDVTTDPEVDEGVLTWYVDESVVGIRNLSESAASYPLITSSYLPGTYEIMVTYSAGEHYANTFTTATLEINKITTDISNVCMNFDSNNDIGVTLNVIGDDGEVLDFGTFNVYHDNILVESIEMEDYDVSFTLNKTFNMELVTFEYLGDEIYDDVSMYDFVYVEKLDSNIYLPYLNAYQSTIVNQSLTFYSDRPINDGRVNVYVDGVLCERIPVNSNEVYIVVNTGNYVAGTYPVYIEYVDSDVYEDAHYQTTLTVKQINTTLYSNNITAHKNEIINLRASVYNYVDETDEGIVEFFIDNQSIKTAQVTNTTVYENYYLADELEYGVHEIKILYYGSQKYLPSNTTAQLNLTKYPNSLSLRNFTLDDDGNIVLNIRAYSYQNTVDEGKIEVYINQTLVTIKTVTDNITTVILPSQYTADNEYLIDIRYTNSTKYEDANLTATINPTKYETSTRLYNFINNDNILNVTGYVYSTNYAQIDEGSIEFYLNNTLIATANVENNRASILYDMDNMEEKQYTLKAVFSGSKSYRQSENSTEINFEINRKTVYITANSQIKTLPGKTINITASLTDYESNIINITAQATITILNQTINTNFTEGILNMEYHVNGTTPEGIYNITVNLEQTKYYKSATRTIRLNVAKNSPYITSTNIITSTKGNTILINATLNLNNEILNENITGIVKINNKTVYQGKFINGQLQYQLRLTDKYTSNTYNITIKSKETTFYHTAEKTITLNLNNKNTYIISKNIISKNGEKIIINATIYDSTTKKPVKGTSKVCIKINEVTLDNIYVTNGHLVYSYVNNYSAKNYTIHIIYGENGVYNQSEWTGTLTIESTPLSIKTSNINTQSGSTVNIRAQVLDDNAPATDVIKTAIKINNQTIIEQNITNGIIDVNYTLPDELPAGTHNLTIIAGDSRKYTGNTTTAQLIVTKRYAYINSSDITANVNSTVTIRASILDSHDNPVTARTKVNIKIAGKNITDIYTDNGMVEFNYTLPSDMIKGIYSIIIQAQESNEYLHATKSSILQVE